MSRRNRSRRDKLCPIGITSHKQRNRRWSNPHDDRAVKPTGCNQVTVRDPNNPRKILGVVKTGMIIACSTIPDSLSSVDSMVDRVRSRI